MDLRRHRLDTRPNPPDLAECADDDLEAVTIDTEAFYMIRAFARSVVDCRRIQKRQTRILLDGYEGKPLAELNLQRLPRQIVLYPAGEARCFELQELTDLEELAEVVRASISWYEREFPIAPPLPELEVLA